MILLATRKIIGRSEIERREDYIKPMKASLGETHPLVELTLDCLEYIPQDRPSAVGILRQLKEIETTFPQNCTNTKLQLMQEIDSKNEENVQIRQDFQRAIDRLQVQIEQKDEAIVQKDTQIAQIQAAKNQLQATVNHLQAEKEPCKKITSLSDEMHLLQIQSSEQRYWVTAARAKVNAVHIGVGISIYIV